MVTSPEELKRPGLAPGFADGLGDLVHAYPAGRADSFDPTDVWCKPHEPPAMLNNRDADNSYTMSLQLLSLRKNETQRWKDQALDFRVRTIQSLMIDWDEPHLSAGHGSPGFSTMMHLQKTCLSCQRRFGSHLSCKVVLPFLSWIIGRKVTARRTNLHAMFFTLLGRFPEN